MKKLKNIVIFITIFLIIFVRSQPTPPPPPKCLTSTNVYSHINQAVIPTNLEWWYMHQLIVHGAIYTDSNLKSTATILEIEDYNTKDTSEKSPLSETWAQSYELDANNNLKYNSISYNDQPGEGSSSAHAKGFFIWNESGGIHVMHSFPKSPVKNNIKEFLIGWNRATGQDNNFASQHAQHLMCITLSTAATLQVIPKYLIYTNANLHTINNIEMGTGSIAHFKIENRNWNAIQNDPNIDITTNIILPWEEKGYLGTANGPQLTTFTQLDTFVDTNIVNGASWMKKINLLQWSDIADYLVGHDITSDPLFTNKHFHKIMAHKFNTNPLSKNNHYFIQTSNENCRIANGFTPLAVNPVTDMGYEIIWNYIHDLPIFNRITNWISHTQIKSRYIIPKGQRMELVHSFSYQWAKNSEKQFVKTGVDHAKLLYGLDANKNNGIFCVGDSNMQGVQELRGGGVFCSEDMHYLVDYYVRRVTNIQGVQFRDPVTQKYVLPAIPYSIYNLVDIDFQSISNYFTINVGTTNEFELRRDDGNSFNPKVFFKGFKTENNLPLLLNYPIVAGQLTPTEKFKLNFYPSQRGIAGPNPPALKDEFLFCHFDNQLCSFEDSISYEVLNDNIEIDSADPTIPNINHIYTPSTPISLNLFEMSKSNNLLLFAKIFRLFYHSNINTFRFIENTIGSVAPNFPLTPPMLDHFCYTTTIPAISTTSLYFYPQCLDLFYLCLLHSQTPITNNIIDNNQLYKGLDDLINGVSTPFIPAPPAISDSHRCIKEMTMHD